MSEEEKDQKEEDKLKELQGKMAAMSREINEIKKVLSKDNNRSQAKDEANSSDVSVENLDQPIELKKYIQNHLQDAEAISKKIPASFGWNGPRIAISSAITAMNQLVKDIEALGDDIMYQELVNNAEYTNNNSEVATPEQNAISKAQVLDKVMSDAYKVLDPKFKERYDNEVWGLYKASSALWDATKVAINPKGHINFTARIALSAAKLAGSALTYTLETAVESAKSGGKNAWKVIEEMTGIKQWQIEAWAEESVKLIEDMKPKLKEAFSKMEELEAENLKKLEALEKELKAINRESSKELETKQQEILALQKEISAHKESMDSLKTKIGECDEMLTTNKEMKANNPNSALNAYITAVKRITGFVIGGGAAVPVAVIAATVEAIDRTVIKGPRAAINRVRVVAGEIKKSAVGNYSDEFKEKRFARARKYVRGKHAKAEKERKTAEEGKIER